MPTYREAARLYHTAPSYNEITQSLAVGSWFDTYCTGFLATRALASVALDFNLKTRQYWVNPAQVDPQAFADHHDLILLLKYLVHVPLKSLIDHQTQLLNANNHPLGDIEEAFKEMLQYIEIVAIDIEAYIAGISPDQLVNSPNYWATVDGWIQNPGAQPTVTALGTMELLCRIVAEPCVTLNNFQTLVFGNGNNPGMEIRQIPAPPNNFPMHIQARKGIPATVFVCAGQQNNNPVIVVTTSQDIWYPYRVMSEWARVVRHTWRPGQAPVQGNGLLNMPTLSNNLMANFNNIPYLPFRPQRITARQNLLAQWNAVPGQTANHQQETAAPFSCPSFDVKSRCFRCRAMFGYAVPPAVNNSEQLDIGYKRPRLKGYTGYICAETIAQAYFSDARGNNPSH
ncbi:hypothetical protein TrVFT333_011878 [Trichoderma virens FT-333]|nr:hypothetical protein TrVFT333_011878 [Trichoderma virens FT-333]